MKAILSIFNSYNMQGKDDFWFSVLHVGAY